MFRRRARITVAPFALLLAVACGGPQVPDHDGYRNPKQTPWSKPKVLTLDSHFEAEADDAVSYPRQQRSRWFAVDLPGDGELDVRLSLVTLGQQAREIDLAFEVLDERFRVMTRADSEEDDAGDTHKTRTLYELAQGRYFVHVYAQERLDAAEFTLRVKYRRGSVDRPYESNFPADVAFVDPLPVVPLFDDAPPPTPKRTTRPTRPTQPKKEPTEAPTGVQGRIVRAVAAAGGTNIIINRGINHGVDKGWRGSVVNAGGTAIANGSFTITSASANESQAQVRATPDAVSSAGRVRLRAP
jgi:hypothetical protein